MGTQTCLVMAGFLAIHIALILNIIAISTHEWVNAEPFNATVKNRTNITTCERGLWETCCEDCEKINETLQPRWFKAGQALEVVGIGCHITATFLLYVFLFGKRMSNSPGFAALIAFLLWIAAFSFLSVIVIFGVRYKDLKGFPNGFEVERAWSYYVALAGTIVTFISSFTSSSEFYMLKTRVQGYENL